MMTKSLPREVTSYDFLKAVAVILMITDHLGYYFYPDNEWFRVFGRMCVPMWFFLIGYARSRDFGVKLWIGALVLVAVNMVVGLTVFPLNILATMIVTRFLLIHVAPNFMRNVHSMFAVGLTFAFLSLPSNVAFEYGTMGLVLALFGYLIRHQDELGEKASSLVGGYMFFAMVSFIVVQEIGFAFWDEKLVVLCIGLLAVFCILMFFRPATYPRLTAALPSPLVALIQLLGRRTLEIYVLHLTLFKVIGLWTDPEHFQLWDWTLYSETGY